MRASDNMLEGMREFSKLSRGEQKVLLEMEEVAQRFDEVHPEYKNFSGKKTPLQEYITDQVRFFRKLAKGFGKITKHGIKK